MWVAKVRFNGDSALIGGMAKKHRVSIVGYPISKTHHADADFLTVHFVGQIFGDEKNRKKFIESMRKQKRISFIEENDGFLIGEIREPKELQPMYEHNIIHIEPIIIKDDGTEVWTLGSGKKEELIKFIEVTERKYAAKLIYIMQKKITNFSVISIHPELTDKQKGAMELAIKSGYYEYPRKIGLEELSGLYGCAYSTFQSHLRKAEIKLLPSLFERSFG